jgi:putative transposase
MPRRARSIVGGLVYHVLNRGNARRELFLKPADYEAFERVLQEAQQREPLRLLAYCLMPNHWHLVVWPERGRDRQVSDFLRWLTVTHTQRWHAHYHSSGAGHLYQGRFKSFPVEADEHLLTVLRYVERNALRANLVEKAEDWRWSSLWRRQSPDAAARSLLSEWPVPCSPHWTEHVNQPQTEAELAALRRCLRRGCPYGSQAWCEAKVQELGLEHTIRRQGRPRKNASQAAPA